MNTGSTNHLQQIASNPKNSAWVSASAGSGKTTILTNRVLRLLLSGVSPNKILCLTFTNAAAGEMEKRINETLSNWIICDEKSLKEKLTQIIGNTPNSDEIAKARSLLIKILDSDIKIKVQTIHSFCQSLIRIFPFEANVKPSFDLLDENGEKLLLKEAQQQVKNLAENNAEIYQIISQINSKLQEESLSDLITKLLSKKEDLIFLKEEFFGVPEIISTIYKKFSVLESDNETSLTEEFLTKINQKDLEKLASHLVEMKQKTNVQFGKQIQDFLRNFSTHNLALYQDSFLTSSEKSLRKFYEKLDDELLQIAQNQYQLITEFSEKINSLKIASDSALLLKLCYLILENYSALKKQRALLDYDDLIIETNHLLQNPDHSNFVKMKMDSGFDHILVDESQDTNSKQWLIIKALSEDFFSGLSSSNKERSIFIVGDEKQSIFSFQGADINLGREVFSHFKNRIGNNLKEIQLNTSYRSGKEILEAVDLIFSDKTRQNAITKLGKFEPHKSAKNSESLVEIWPQIINKKEDKPKKNYEWKLHFLEENQEKEAGQMAKIIATKINNWVLDQRKITAKNRAVKYGDIMILLRNRGEFSKQLIKYFHQFNIPFSSISKLKFSESLMLQDLLALAKFALLKEDNLNLTHLLKSPFFLVSEDDLLHFCEKKNRDKLSLYDAIFDESIKSQLDEIITKSQELDCFEFFHFFLRKENFDKNFISYFGSQSLQIIDRFFEIVLNFSKNSSPNLQKFLEFIEIVDPQIALNETTQNSVKITTIHSAKGLQSSIVIMPDCCFNLRKIPSNTDVIFWVDELPIWCARKNYENQIIKNYREKRFNEINEEYLRLLYVGITRPEDELYIGGFGSDNSSDSWYEIIRNSLPEKLVTDFGEIAERKIENSNKTKTLPPRVENISKVKEILKKQINQGTIKGNLIHKILEIFGKNHREEKSWLKNLAQNIINKETLLSEKEKAEVLKLSIDFIDSKLFDEIFCGEIKCEFEISDGKNLYRLDLLVEKESEILIIDYKSDDNLHEEALELYKKQLNSYKESISKLHKNKKISTAILHIKSLKLHYFI